MSEVLQTTGFELRVLGSIEASSAGTPVALGGKTQRRLLAVMVLSRGRVVSVDRLVDVTWGDEPPARAAHNIRTYLHRLRNALDHSAEIITVEPVYLRSAVLDSDLFEQDLDTARRH
jgi:DNA-binding SARP family transcriptional activator